jgi:hypothetical protein
VSIYWGLVLGVFIGVSPFCRGTETLLESFPRLVAPALRTGNWYCNVRIIVDQAILVRGPVMLFIFQADYKVEIDPFRKLVGVTH